MIAYYYKKPIAVILLIIAGMLTLRVLLSSKSDTVLESSLSSKSMKIISQAQSGILPEGDTAAYYGTLRVDYSMLKVTAVKRSFIANIKRFSDVLKDVSLEKNMDVTGTISFGKALWSELTEFNPSLTNAGKDLFDFPGYGKAVATQEDVYIHIHSNDQGVCYDAAERFLSLFMKDILTIRDERMGFVWRDNRDFIGFIDGTENSHGDQARSDAALNSDGSSYVIVQRFVHDLDKWMSLTVKEQEDIVGRKKADSEAITPPSHISHVAHADITYDGEPVKIVRHSLPYGMPGADKGLWFTAYCHSMKHHNEIQRSIYGLRDGNVDGLMSYITPVTGGYYFTPSLVQLQQL